MRSLAAFLLSLLVSGAQQAPKPTPSSPAVVGDPVWSRTVQMPDGRSFVTDGGLAIDVKVAKPSTIPTTALPVESGNLLARHFTATPAHEIGLSGLETGTGKNTFVGPAGIGVNGNYVAFLRRVAPRARLLFRGNLDPIVVKLDQQPIGILMPLAPPAAPR